MGHAGSFITYSFKIRENLITGYVQKGKRASR